MSEVAAVCTRLHAIGFPCEMDRRTAEFISNAATATKRRVACPEGEYRIWRSPQGAEIWLHYPKRVQTLSASMRRRDNAAVIPRPFDPIDDLGGMTVTHGGSSDVGMRLSRVLRVSNDNPLDGVCIATLPSRRAGEKPISFSFEMVGFGTETLRGPTDARVQVTGLAQQVWAFPSEAAYLKGTPARRLIGKGALAEVSVGDVPDVALIYRPKPGTLWLATGDVKRSIRLVNPVTREPYYWVLLATDRGDFDLIAATDRIAGDVSDGHTVQAVVSMAGRVLRRMP